MQVLKSLFNIFSLYQNVIAGLLISGLFHYAVYTGIKAGIGGMERNTEESFSYIDIEVLPGLPGETNHNTPEKVKTESQPEKRKYIQRKEIKQRESGREIAEESFKGSELGSTTNSGEAGDGRGNGVAQPEYPMRSRIEGEEGKVVYNLSIDDNGRVKDASVIESSGFKRLDRAAKEALLKSSFIPGKDKEKKITFTFRLDDK